MPTLKDTLKSVGYGAARTLIASGAGFLVTTGWLSSSKTAAFEDAALGAVGVVGILAWSAGEKIMAWVKQELAKVPAASPLGELVTAAEVAAPVLEPLAQKTVAAEAAQLGLQLSPPPPDPVVTIPVPAKTIVFTIPVPAKTIVFTPPILQGPNQ